MRNISWCPCLKVRVNFYPEENYAAHFTVVGCKHLSRQQRCCAGLLRWNISRHHTNIESPAECRRCCGGHASVSEQRIDTIDKRQRVILTGPRILMKPKAILL